jgi:hypothetical protein
MNSQVPSSAQVLLALAGLGLPAEREAFLAAGLEGSTRPIAQALSRQDYGDTEPAARFRPPANESR